jgi:hypothetical protein
VDKSVIDFKETSWQFTVGSTSVILPASNHWLLDCKQVGIDSDRPFVGLIFCDVELCRILVCSKHASLNLNLHF